MPTKSLVPHLERYVPSYFRKKYPEFYALMQNFLLFLENHNGLNFFQTDAERDDNSIYQNIVGFNKHYNIDDLPVKNKTILNAYFKEFAEQIDFRNSVLTFDNEVMRDLAKFSTQIFSTKGSWSSYNILFAIISNYLFNGAERGVIFKAYFNKDETFDSETLPEFYDIFSIASADISNFFYGQFVKDSSGSYGFVKLVDVINEKIYVDVYEGIFDVGDGNLIDFDDVVLTTTATQDNDESLSQNDIVLSEYPLYVWSQDLNGTKVEIGSEIAVKGGRPFEYQIVSKSDLFISGNFVSKLKENFNPAGYRVEIVYVPEDGISEIYVDSRIFPKLVFDLDDGFEHFPASMEILSLNNNNDLALLGAYQDGTSYYATATGSETTEKSLFHLGTGNADNKLDLNMGEVTLTMDVPASNPALDTDYAISGTYSYVGEIEVWARKTPSGAWVSIDAIGISLVDGVWSGNIQIPSASFAQEDEIEIEVRDAELTGLSDSQVVTVESGVNLEAYQVAGSTEAGETAGNTLVTAHELDNDHIYLGGYTASTKLFNVDVTGNYTNKVFVAKLTKSYELIWVRFFDGRMVGYGKSFCLNGDNIYVVAIGDTDGTTPYRTTVHKINKSDGVTTETIQQSYSGSAGFAYSVDVHDGSLYTFGGNGVWTSGWTGSRWSFPLDLSEELGRIDFMTGGLGAISKHITGVKMYPNGRVALSRYAYDDFTYYELRELDSTRVFDISMENYMDPDVANFLSSAKCDMADYSAENPIVVGVTQQGIIRLVPNTAHYHEILNHDTVSVNRVGYVRWDGTTFLTWLNDGKKFMLLNVANQNTYSASTQLEITPHEILDNEDNNITTWQSYISEDANHILVSGNIKGKILETSPSSGFWDGFLLLIEK